jgi:hypothetical protein
MKMVRELVNYEGNTKGEKEVVVVFAMAMIMAMLTMTAMVMMMAVIDYHSLLESNGVISVIIHIFYIQ